MSSTLPSKNIEVLKSLLSKKIISVKRQLFKDDMDLDEYQQNADGPIEFRFDDNTVVHFFANTEMFSVGVIAEAMPNYGDSYEYLDVSKNPFWSVRVNQEISKITFLKSSNWSEGYPSEFGIEILFGNGKKVLIEYLDEEEYPDMIKLAEHYTGQNCIISCLKG